MKQILTGYPLALGAAGCFVAVESSGSSLTQPSAVGLPLEITCRSVREETMSCEMTFGLVSAVGYLEWSYSLVTESKIWSAGVCCH